VGHCHLCLGKLYRRTGQREQTQEHLATATTMYREMDEVLAGAGGGGIPSSFLSVRSKEDIMAGQDNLHIAREIFAAWNAHDMGRGHRMPSPRRSRDTKARVSSSRSI